MADELDGQSAPKRDLKKIIAMAYVALNLTCMGVGSYLVYAVTLGYTTPQVSSAELDREITAFRQTLLEKPMIYTLETFNTNLSGLPRRLIRMELNLEMLDAEGFEEIIDLGAKGRDTVVKIINSKTFAEIETLQGKLHLKNEIIAQLNKHLDQGVVKNVYFSDFVVQ
jgi:flagellar protein FliL